MSETVGIKTKVQKLGRALSGMVMPNIGAFIAWGFITALFIEKGWLPNAQLAEMVTPMLKYVLPVLIGYTGGKMIAGDRGSVIGAIATVGIVVGAGDTFRAAAIDQLEVWANRCNVDIIKHQEGADPGAVIFDAIKASKARGVDVLICDTAGRLHNKSNLMNELGKVFKIVDREYPEAKKEVLLVVDATTGQNAVSQAKSFKEVCDITGLALTKLDGTAKGGVILAVKSEVDVPVKLIGVGEKMEDLQDFDSKSFVDALFS